MADANEHYFTRFMSFLQAEFSKESRFFVFSADGYKNSGRFRKNRL